MEKIDHWNSLINISHNTPSIDIKNHAEMLLRQLNTASGDCVKPEIQNFIVSNNLQKYAKYSEY